MSIDPFPELFDLSSFRYASIFADCRYPWQALAAISTYIKTHGTGEILGEVSPQAYLVNRESITIGKGSIVEPGAYIEGPCLIGENCTIRHGAYIRGNFIAGDGSVVGHASEVKNTIFLNRAHAAHFAYVGDSILGNSTNLGAGIRCANLKLSRKNIRVNWQGEIVETEIRKLGLILGDHSQLGCNCVANPGTIIGSHVYAEALLNLQGTIPAHSKLRSLEKFHVESIPR